MNVARPPHPGCPEAETLAALLDGRLDDEGRQRTVDHLAGCERCRETFAEAVRFAEEPEAEAVAVGPPAAVAAAWSKRLAWLAVPLAAAAALAVILWRPLVGGPGGGEASAVALAELLPAGSQLAQRLPSGWQHPGWSESRGGAPSAGRDLAFRLGVRAMDLAVALRAGDGALSGQLAGQLAALLDGLPESEPLRLAAGALRDPMGGSEASRQLAALETAVKRHPGVAPRHFAFGAWAEAGRLAAAAGDLALLRSAPFRRRLGALRRSDLAARWGAELAALADLLDGNVDSVELPRIGALFAQILEKG